MKNCIYGLLVLLVLVSCSEKQKNRILPLSDYDSISVKIDFPFLSNYTNLASYVHNGNVYVVGYNHHAHSLDFIDLSGGVNSVVELQREGAHAVYAPVSFCLTPQNIIWKDASGIVWLSMEGLVKKRMPLDSTEKFLMKPLGVTNASYVNISHLQGNVLFPISAVKLDNDTKIGKIYNPDRDSLDFLPIQYPRSVVDNADNLGSLAFPAITGNVNKIVYNFPCSSIVYCYDMEKGVHTEFEINTSSINNIVQIDDFKSLSSRKRFESESTCERFGRAHYSPELGIYYRLHYGKKTHLFDKKREIYLMIYDVEKKCSVEYLLPSLFTGQYIVENDAIYFMYDNSDDITFQCAKIDLKKYV